MRSRLTCEEWRGLWLVGFTSRTIYDGRHWLFYVAQIKQAYDSHAELWVESSSAQQIAKAADKNYLGDLFRPKSPIPKGNGRFNPRNYVTPRRHAHRWKTDNGWFNAWHNDVRYYRTGECAPLLRADPDQTYLWNEPTIYFDSNHVRDYKKWTTIKELLDRLRTDY
nr:hypothetical protein [Planctomicrobium sp.]